MIACNVSELLFKNTFYCIVDNQHFKEGDQLSYLHLTDNSRGWRRIKHLPKSQVNRRQIQNSHPLPDFPKSHSLPAPTFPLLSGPPNTLKAPTAQIADGVAESSLGLGEAPSLTRTPLTAPLLSSTAHKSQLLTWLFHLWITRGHPLRKNATAVLT